MDFELIFWLAIIVVYFIVQLRGASQKQKQRTGTAPRPPVPLPQDTDAPPQEAPTLEDALREIRIAMGMEERPAPPPPPEPEPAYEDEFQPIPSRFADAEFEQRPTAFGPARSLHEHEPPPLPRKPKLAPPPRKHVQKRPGGLTPLAATTTTPNEPLQATVARKLNDAQVAREAFLFGEIFGPPRALRKLR